MSKCVCVCVCVCVCPSKSPQTPHYAKVLSTLFFLRNRNSPFVLGGLNGGGGTGGGDGTSRTRLTRGLKGGVWFQLVGRLNRERFKFCLLNSSTFRTITYTLHTGIGSGTGIGGGAGGSGRSGASHRLMTSSEVGGRCTGWNSFDP